MEIKKQLVVDHTFEQEQKLSWGNKRSFVSIVFNNHDIDAYSCVDIINYAEALSLSLAAYLFLSLSLYMCIYECMYKVFCFIYTSLSAQSHALPPKHQSAGDPLPRGPNGPGGPSPIAAAGWC